MSNVDWHNGPHTRLHLKPFSIPSAAWVDPQSRLIIGSKDLRKFEKSATNADFAILPNVLEPYKTLSELSKISCEPNGMVWSVDNSSLFFSDGFTKNISQCVYDLRKGDVTNCSTIFNVKNELFENAVPKGMATDENSHLWVAIENVDGKGSVLEIDPETKSVISTIGKSMSMMMPFM